MRILVFSDSHGNTEGCEKIIRTISGVDMILHAGDHANDARRLEQMFPDIPVNYVNGNCDFSSAPQELVIEADGHKIFLTHGHNYYVKSEENYTTLINKALSAKCGCVVFGHTHLPYNDCSKKITVLNPGSIKYTKTYGLIETENGILRSAVCDASYII